MPNRIPHGRIRNNVQVVFSPKRNKKLEPYVRQLASDAKDTFESDNLADQRNYALSGIDEISNAVDNCRNLRTIEEEVKT